MSILGDELLYTDLITTHDDYKRYSRTWEIITRLRDGASAILEDIEYFLPSKNDEEPEEYQTRLGKFAYTPIMSTAIRETAAKLASAPVFVNTSGEADEFWAYFKEHNDKKRQRDERQLIQQIFLDLLYYGRAYAVVDRAQPTEIPRSVAEEANLALPYINVYPAELVLDWDEDWFKIQQLIPLKTPTSTGYILRWTYFLPEFTEIYEVPVLLKDGQVFKVWDGSQFVLPTKRGLTVPIASSNYHGLLSPLMATASLPVEMWIGQMVYLKQIQHMRIESGWTDSGTLAGTIQRVFTPTAPVTNDNPAHLIEPPEYDKIELGNRRVLVGGNFQFVESAGTAIRNLSEQLDKIEKQIKAIVSMRFASADTSVLAQSGASKAADMEMLRDTMMDYGLRVAGFYQDILQNVARIVGLDPDTISVQGLSDFTANILSESLLNAVSVAGLADNIPVTAQKIFWKGVSKQLTGTVTPEDEQMIDMELEQIFYGAQTEPESIEEGEQQQPTEAEV